MSQLPLSSTDACVAAPPQRWRAAADRANQYLAALKVEPAQRRRIIRQAVARAASETAWASGTNAMSFVMIGIQQALTNADGPPAANEELLAASSRTRLLSWLGTAANARALDPAGRKHTRLASMPPMQRTNMTPAGITRRPAPLRWLRRVLRHS